MPRRPSTSSAPRSGSRSPGRSRTPVRPEHRLRTHGRIAYRASGCCGLAAHERDVRYRGRGTRPRRCYRRGHARTRRNSWRDAQATGRVRAAPPRLALYRLCSQHSQGPVERLAGDRLAVARELADLLHRPPGRAEVPGGLHLPGRQPVLAAAIPARSKSQPSGSARRQPERRNPRRHRADRRRLTRPRSGQPTSTRKEDENSELSRSAITTRPTGLACISGGSGSPRLLRSLIPRTSIRLVRVRSLIGPTAQS